MWKHHPLDFHKDAPLAHLASMAALNQGKFWEFKEKVFAGQPDLKKETLLRYARELKLDMGRFQRDLDGKAGQPAIDADLAETTALGVTGTPGFFVNGRFLSGAKPFNEFAKLINQELNKAGKPIPDGAKGL